MSNESLEKELTWLREQVALRKKHFDDTSLFSALFGREISVELKGDVYSLARKDPSISSDN